MLAGAASAGLITLVVPRYILKLPLGEQLAVAIFCISTLLAVVTIYGRSRARRIEPPNQKGSRP